MALELDSITFAVKTDALKEAVAAVHELKTAVEDLSKANGISNESAKAVNAVARAQKKAAKEAADALKEQSKEAEDTAPKMDAVTRALEKQAIKMQVLRGDTVDFTDSQVQLERAYTSGQASALANLKLMGATDEQYKQLAASLAQYNKETGANPFDKSGSSLRRLQQQLEELSNVDKLLNENLGLSREQIKGLSRDIASINNSAVSAGLGLDSKEVQDRIAALKQETVAASQLLNQREMLASEADKASKAKAKAMQDEQAMLKTMREQEWAGWAKSVDAEDKAINARNAAWKKYYAEQESAVQSLERQRTKALSGSASGSSKSSEQAMDSAVGAYAKQQENAAKSTAWLERELRRADNALVGLNDNLAISSSNRILKFKEMLAASGMDADKAALKLKAYSEAIDAVDKTNKAKRKNDREDELRYLARATSVQMGDVAVSLAGGMNPLTIMMQQGDQLRGIFAQVGANSKEMEQAMGQAFGQIIGGFVDVGKAMGQFAFGAIKSTGDAVINFGLQAIDPLIARFGKLNGAVNLASGGFGRFTSILRTVAGITIGAAIAQAAISLGVFAFAYSKVLKEEKEFSIAMTRTGAVMGMTTDSAYALAKSMQSSEISVSTSVVALTEIAKVGGLAGASIKDIIKVSNDMKTYAGADIADTVKEYSKLKDKPVEALTELARTTGLVSPETIKLVAELERQGKTAEAGAIAMNELTNANKSHIDTIKTEMNGFTEFGIKVGKIWDSVWDSIMGITRKDTLSDRIEDARSKVANFSIRQQNMPEYLRGNDSRLKEAQNNLDALFEEQRLLNKTNTIKQENIALAVGEAKWQKELTTAINVNMSEQVRFAKAEKKIREDALKFGKSELEVQILLNAARKDIFKKHPKTESEKEIDKFNKLKDSLVGRSGDLSSTFVGDVAMINKRASSEEERLDLLTRLVKLQPQYIDQLKSEQKAKELLEKAWEESVKNYTEQTKLDIETQNNSDKITASLNEEVMLLELRTALIGQSDAAIKKEIETRKIQLALEKELMEITNDKAEYKDERRADARNRAATRINMIQAEINYDKLMQLDKLEKDVSGAIVTALFEGGKAGSKSLRDIITAELMKPVTLYVNAVVSNLMGGIIGASSSGTGMGSAGSSGSLSSILSAGNNLGLFSGLFSGASSYGMGLAATGIGAIATGVGSQAAMLAAQTGSFGAAGLAATTQAAGGALAGGAGIASSAMGALAAIPGWGWALAGATALFGDKLFGRKLTEQGVQGSYGDGGFEGNSYSFSKGGWLRSNKTTTSELDTPMQKLLDSSYKGINESMKAVASQFKTEMTGSFAAIKVNLMGLSEADAQAKLSEAIASSTKQALDSIALPGWAKDVVEELGDTFSMEALTSALGGISAMKNALDALGYSSQAWADITAGSVNELIAEFGSVQVAQQNMSSYYQAYYSEQEQLAFAMSDLNKQLQALGITAPTTTEAYRALVDDALVSGNEKLAASLMKLAPTFKSVTDALGNLTSALTSEVTRLKISMSTNSINTSSSLYSGYAQFVKQQELAGMGNQDAITMLPELSKSIEEQSTKYAKTSADVTKVQAWLVEGLSQTVSTINANAKMEQLLADVNSKLENLSAEAKANAEHAAKSARILERVTPDGQSLSVTVVA